MNEKKIALRNVAKLYYEENQTQSEISKRMGISRPKVSRMLSEAKRQGIVKIFIDSVSDDMMSLENRLYSAFNLKGVKVVAVPDDDSAFAAQITTDAAAKFFFNYLNEGDTIGVSWGWTLNEVVKKFPEAAINDIEIYQVSGSVDNAKSRSYASEIVNNLSNKIKAENAYTLPCPALVDNVIIADTLKHDVKLHNLLERGSKCNKLFVNIALPDKTSCLYHAGYLYDNDVANLKQHNAVGNICSRFFDESGNICDAQLDARTLGISIDDIKKADCVMSCVAAPRKAHAVYCALKSGLINVLVIDSITAELIIRMLDSEKVT